MRMAKALGCVWQDPEAGPEAESEFWRNNAASLAGFVEKLHAPAPRIALGVAAAARSRSYATWRQLEQEVCSFAHHSQSLKLCRSWQLRCMQHIDHALLCMLIHVHCAEHVAACGYVSPFAPVLQSQPALPLK